MLILVAPTRKTWKWAHPSHRCSDRTNPHPKGLPLYEWTWKTVFLHSLVGRSEGLSSNIFGITFSDALLEVAMPDLPPSQVEIALNAIVNEAYYLREKDGRYYANTDPTEARIVSTIKQGLLPDDIAEQLTIVARKVVSHNSPTFQVAQDVSQPEHIPDHTGRPVLAIIPLDANKIDPNEMATTFGEGQPRLEQNNVFMLVPETVQVAGDAWSEDRVKKAQYRKDRLNDLARTVIAMRRLQNRPEDYGMSAGKLQTSGFTAKLNLRNGSWPCKLPLRRPMTASCFPALLARLRKKASSKLAVKAARRWMKKSIAY